MQRQRMHSSRHCYGATSGDGDEGCAGCCCGGAGGGAVGASAMMVIFVGSQSP